MRLAATQRSTRGLQKQQNPTPRRLRRRRGPLRATHTQRLGWSRRNRSAVANFERQTHFLVSSSLCKLYPTLDNQTVGMAVRKEWANYPDDELISS